MLPNGRVIIGNHSTFRILSLPLPGWEPPGERGPDWLPGLSRMHLHEVNVVVLFCPPVSSPIQQGRPALIQLRPESPEELRERLRQMSDLELRRFGQRARRLSDPKMNFGATEPHVIELEAARTGWRRRHPAKSAT